MKHILTHGISAIMTTAAIAGPTQDVVTTPAPPATLGGWFVGGTYGQINDADNLVGGVGSLLGSLGGLTGEFLPGEVLGGIRISDLDFDMYTLHVGRDLNEPFMGWDTSVYLELAYLDGSMGVYSAFQESVDVLALGLDLEIIPITANFKFERVLWQKLSAYVSGGIGFAYTELNANLMGLKLSSDDIEFYAQMAFGLSYEVVDNFDVYGGLRWLRMSDLDFGTSIPLELVDDQFAWEVGMRYHF